MVRNWGSDAVIEGIFDGVVETGNKKKPRKRREKGKEKKGKEKKRKEKK